MNCAALRPAVINSVVPESNFVAIRSTLLFKGPHNLCLANCYEGRYTGKSRRERERLLLF